MQGTRLSWGRSRIQPPPVCATPEPRKLQCTIISCGGCLVWNIPGFSKQAYFHLHSFLRLEELLEVEISRIWRGREERDQEKSWRRQRKGIFFPSSPIFKLFLNHFFLSIKFRACSIYFQTWLVKFCHSNSPFHNLHLRSPMRLHGVVNRGHASPELSLWQGWEVVGCCSPEGQKNGAIGTLTRVKIRKSRTPRRVFGI